MQHRTAPGHMDHGILVDWEPLRPWVERVLGDGRLGRIGLAAATLGIYGFMLYAFQKALQNYQVMGSGYF